MRMIVFLVAFSSLHLSLVGQIPPIQSDIDAVKSQITQAEAEDAKYSGGLVKSLIALRLETLRQTLAMLEQKAGAQEQGVDLSYTVDGTPYQPPADREKQLEKIQSEFVELAGKIEAQKATVSKYSGGLVLAMALSTLATLEQTAAMLDQRRIALEYDLPLYAAPQGASSGTAASTPAADSTPQMTETPLEITKVDAKVTETNDSWWKYAWQFTVKNNSAQPVTFSAAIEFQDKDGFVVDDDREYNLVVPANSEKTFTGYDLVDASVAGNIAKIAVKSGR